VLLSTQGTDIESRTIERGGYRVTDEPYKRQLQRAAHLMSKVASADWAAGVPGFVFERTVDGQIDYLVEFRCEYPTCRSADQVLCVVAVCHTLLLDKLASLTVCGGSTVFVDK
jgi:hypothetical protein